MKNSSFIYKCSKKTIRGGGRKTPKRYHAFTLIEVVLVLAIAGLIFAMVFIALPALQRAQRDRQRKNDAAIIAAAIRDYMRHNKGKPPDVQSFSISNDSANYPDNPDFKKYIKDTVDPEITNFILVENITDEKFAIGKGYQFYVGFSDGVNMMMTGKNSTRAVLIVVGAKCYDGGPKLYDDNLYLIYDATISKYDVGIYRFYESGKWVCTDI